MIGRSKKRNDIVLTCCAAVLIGLVLFGLYPASVLGQGENHSAAPAKVYSAAELEEVIEGIIDWKKADNGSAAEGYLLNDTFLELAGSTAGDWYPLALGRYNYPDNDEAYLAVITEAVQKRYQEPGKLSAVKATEWHRIALAVLAMGGDPRAVGVEREGKPIDLIADGTYDRGRTVSLGRQGINGWIWGLLTLDAGKYEIPAGAFSSREDIIREILSLQLAEGGFTLTGTVPDPDLTAMAIQALAPYYASPQVYTYERSVLSKEVRATVQEAVDEALAWLARAQRPTGDYTSWGTQNAESTAQVIIALCALGIDPQKEGRFIKNGVSLLDGLMGYRMPDGGFIHAQSYDPENPTSRPDRSNSMAGEQSLCALVAVWRQMKGLSFLYDFSTDPAAAGEQAVFSAEERARVDALPETLTTAYYVEVVRLQAGLEQSEAFPGKETYAARLKAAREEVEGIQEEIDGINRDVREKLYPFQSIVLKDRGMVKDIVARYERLSPYDREKILRWEDVIKTQTQLDNEVRAIQISILLGSVALAGGSFLVQRWKSRAGRRAREMEELSKLYEGEDSR